MVSLVEGDGGLIAIPPARAAAHHFFRAG